MTKKTLDDHAAAVEDARKVSSHTAAGLYYKLRAVIAAYDAERARCLFLEGIIGNIDACLSAYEDSE